MDSDDADKPVSALDPRTQGRSDGIALAMQMIELLVCEKKTTMEQRKILLSLYDALLNAKHQRQYR